MSEDSLQTSFWAMIIAQTIGSVDMPGYGQRKMPAPRQYVAIVVTWGVLQLVSGIGEQASRAAAAVGWVLTLAGLVIGPFGKKLVGLFNTVATNFPSNPSPSTTTSSPGSTA